MEPAQVRFYAIEYAFLWDRYGSPGERLSTKEAERLSWQMRNIWYVIPAGSREYFCDEVRLVLRRAGKSTMSLDHHLQATYPYTFLQRT